MNPWQHAKKAKMKVTVCFVFCFTIYLLIIRSKKIDQSINQSTEDGQFSILLIDLSIDRFF